ncbi:hypothetical protein SLS60_004216 [Paraconiothyrium brasiliense]|uniref:Uncharacterized protein n=1 Tax=Paraconiothyrium brasiliense TaxID=300254 RepID=A0ABR3RRQ4_9PLEO
MPLRKRLKSIAADGHIAKGDKKGKRQRLADFFRSRKQKKSEDSDKEAAAASIPVAVKKDGPTRPPRDSKIAESTRPAKSSSSIDVQRFEAEAEETPLPTPPPESTQSAETEKVEIEKAEPPNVEYLSKEHIHTLFSGAPNFFVQKTDKRAVPRVSYPWDADLRIKDVSDSVLLAEPAFFAATLHRHLPASQQSVDQDKPHQGYDVDVVEVPSMLSAQGIEPVSSFA